LWCNLILHYSIWFTKLILAPSVDGVQGKTTPYYIGASDMKNTRLTLMLVTALTTATLSSNTFADDSVTHSGKASKHSVLASSQGLATTASVASAVVAVPVVVTGSAIVATGSVIAESAESVAKSARHDSSSDTSNEPIVITETIITADPAPNKVKIVSKTTTTATTTR
jgi:hypothetical protein